MCIRDRPYTLADVILAMRTPCADAEMRLAACITEQDGVETFIPPSRPADFFDISQEEWIRLFRLVKKRASLVFVDCPAQARPAGPDPTTATRCVLVLHTVFDGRKSFFLAQSAT